MVIDCEAGTVAEALRAAVAQAPRYAQRVLCCDRLLITMALNGHHDASPDVTAKPLAAGDRVDVFPPVAGG